MAKHYNYYNSDPNTGTASEDMLPSVATLTRSSTRRMRRKISWKRSRVMRREFLSHSGQHLTFDNSLLTFYIRYDSERMDSMGILGLSSIIREKTKHDPAYLEAGIRKQSLNSHQM